MAPKAPAKSAGKKPAAKTSTVTVKASEASKGERKQAQQNRATKMAVVADKSAGKVRKVRAANQAVVKRTTTDAYRALQLRNLPELFQEHELKKFIGQFDHIEVDRCYVVRNKKSKSSRGIAYVTFKDPKGVTAEDHESLLAAVFDEFDGMLLGGNTVSPKWVKLNHPMPSDKLVLAAARLDWKRMSMGAKMTRHDVVDKRTSAADVVKALYNAKKTEDKANKFFASVGLDYQFHGFGEQVARLKKDAIPNKKQAAEEKKKSKIVTRVTPAVPAVQTETVSVGFSPKTTPKSRPAAPPVESDGSEDSGDDSDIPMPEAKAVKPAAKKVAAKRAAPKKAGKK